MGVYIDILNETPLVGIPGNLESTIQTVAELYSGVLDIGTVVDGPVCTSMNAEPSLDGGKVVEGADPDHDRFYTWWQIEVNGEVGWYPEVVGQYSHWLWDQEGIFNRKLIMYYMIPIAKQEAACPTPNIYSGLVIEPASSAMNLRIAPNGNIIGRFDIGQSATIFGEPECSDSVNWWQSDRGGYLAETDPETRALLLMPYVPAPELTVVPDTTTRPINLTPVPDTSDDNSNDDTSDDKSDSESRPPSVPTIIPGSLIVVTAKSNPPRR